MRQKKNGSSNNVEEKSKSKGLCPFPTGTQQARVTTIESKEGKCLTEEKEILERWTEYCSELYTHVATNKDPNLLKVPPSSNNARHSILRAEIIEAVSSLKPGKSAGKDNITGELVQAAGEATIDMLLLICKKSGRQECGQNHGSSHWSSPYPKKET
ncbi:endonuclease-reverse transcriptase [Plakobranchus ocellatus]|uniref:Endonuclease-reverse transcriptase n=1 Tax=Plakobranchus ocellatus TaxID=259542 RepID=A0AAV4DS86_9GAST|nr:endonuclease-reverse transcriptase [Plakobranchus ocellatus]